MNVLPGWLTASMLRRKEHQHQDDVGKSNTTHNPLSKAPGPTPPAGGGQGSVNVVVVAESGEKVKLTDGVINEWVHTVPSEEREGDGIPDGGVNLGGAERERVVGTNLDGPVDAHGNGCEDESSRED